MRKKRNARHLKKKPATMAARTYHVYVVELEPAPRDGGDPAVYVGMTGLTPEERVVNHKRGHKASRVVKKRGLCLLPDLFPKGGPFTHEEAKGLEVSWADTLRNRGYVVYGGH